MAEVASHIEPRDVADGSGELDAGRAAADDDEVERRMGSGLLHLAFGQFKGEKDTATDLGGILDSLEAGGELCPVVVAEVGVGGAGGEDEVVVLELGAGLELHALCWEVEAE